MGGLMDTRELARRVRLHAIRMNSIGGGAHVGAVLSCADILAVLYGGVLRVDPDDPKRPDRDRFVLSKGHAAAGLYAVLAECGFIPRDQLSTYYGDGSALCGHASHKVPGVEVSTGALGHGLPLAAGMAFAAKLAGQSHRVFCLLSDGECDEGSTWEAALFAGHHGLNRLVAIVDYNRIQGIARIGDVLELHPLAEKWASFRWEVRTVDGHDHVALREALETAPSDSRPVCILADTVKGKGVSFMEDTVLWHYRIPRGAEFEAAVRELEQNEYEGCFL
jgi:transketolase